MKRTIHWVAAILASAILSFADRAHANSEGETDGPSRGQIFSMFVREPAETGLGVLSSSLPTSFQFPLHVRADGVFGIDVSHHNEDFCNCQIDWNVLSDQKISFAYLKATQGSLFRDNKFLNNWTTLGKHPNIHRGAYHFLSARNDPIDQAKNYLSVIGTLQAKDLPPCLDMEWDMAKDEDGKQRDVWTDLSSDEIVERALKWLKHVEDATGRIPIIYTANSWWTGRIKQEKMALFARYPIWIADYSEKGLGQEKPNVPQGRTWAMWQFTEKGILERGMPGHVDANIFKGSLTEFRRTFGIALTSTPPDAPTSSTSGVPNSDNPPVGPNPASSGENASTTSPGK